jgi:hypothetical protein
MPHPIIQMRRSPENEHGCEREIDPERGIETELVLGIEGADKAERAVDRVEFVMPEGKRIEQHQRHSRHGAERQRANIENSHRNQRTHDVRHILDRGAGGDRGSR